LIHVIEKQVIQMRVISGTAKGRSLKAVPGTNTRPTTDKVKEALFSIIGPYFDGGTVLDLFAGTGGLGIEALSRGMDQAVFIDIEKVSLDTVRANLKTTGFDDRAELYRNDAFRAIKALGKRKLRFQLVFLDPPYRMKLAQQLMTELLEQDLLEKNAVVVVEQDAEAASLESCGPLQLKRRAQYGDIAVLIYTLEPVGDEIHEPSE
jgi:16S rRNA (guanine966-N2)-methyltransferase